MRLIRYIKRDGTPYPKGLEGHKLWVKDYENPKIRQVVKTILPNGATVSTIWLGFDHSLGFGGRQLLYESRVFPRYSQFESIYQRNYSTEEEAKSGHDQLCKKWSEEGSKGDS